MWFRVGLRTQHLLRTPRAQLPNRLPGMLQGHEHRREVLAVVQRLVDTLHEVLLEALVEADCLEAEELGCGKETMNMEFSEVLGMSNISTFSTGH